MDSNKKNVNDKLHTLPKMDRGNNGRKVEYVEHAPTSKMYNVAASFKLDWP